MHHRHRARLAALATMAATLGVGALALAPADAAPAPTTGTVTGSLGVAGIPVAIPAEASFAGTIDEAAAKLQGTVTADDVTLRLPLAGQTFSLTAGLTNPGGITGTLGTGNATLAGNVRLTLKDAVIPGVDLPLSISSLGCSFTFPLALQGTWDAGTRVVTGTQSGVKVPSLGPLCTLGLNSMLKLALGSEVDIDINDIISSLPAGDVSMRIALAAPATTTTQAPPTSGVTTAPPTTVDSSTTTPTTEVPVTTTSTTEVPATTVPPSSGPTTATTATPAPTPTPTPAPPASVTAARPTYVG